MTSQLHERIRKARERAGMKQRELAEAVGVTTRTLGNWERGDSVPRNSLTRLEDVLGVSLRDDGDTDSPPETLRELVQRRMYELGMIHKGKLNFRELHRRGGGDSAWAYETARQMAQGLRTNIEDSTLELVADAIGVHVSEVRLAAGRRLVGEPFELPDRAAELTPAERRLMIDLLDALLGVGVYAEGRPDLPRQRRARRDGAPELDLSQVEAMRLAEPDSMDSESVNDNGDTQ